MVKKYILFGLIALALVAQLTPAFGQTEVIVSADYEVQEEVSGNMVWLGGESWLFYEEEQETYEEAWGDDFDDSHIFDRMPGHSVGTGTIGGSYHPR